MCTTIFTYYYLSIKEKLYSFCLEEEIMKKFFHTKNMDILNN